MHRAWGGVLIFASNFMHSPSFLSICQAVLFLVQLAAELSFLSLIGYIPGTVLLTASFNLTTVFSARQGSGKILFPPQSLLSLHKALQFSCSVITCLELGVLRELEGQWQPQNYCTTLCSQKIARKFSLNKGTSPTKGLHTQIPHPLVTTEKPNHFLLNSPDLVHSQRRCPGLILLI